MGKYIYLQFYKALFKLVSTLLAMYLVFNWTKMYFYLVGLNLIFLGEDLKVNHCAQNERFTTIAAYSGLLL